MLLVWFGIQAALAAPDRFGMLLAGGIAAGSACRRSINLGGVDRADAGHRPDAAVLLGRRVVAVRLDDRRRAAAQRRPPRHDDGRDARAGVDGRRRRRSRSITGGGTAGHVLPALAIAEALVDAGHDAGDDPLRRRRSGASRRGCCPPTPFPHTFLDVVGAAAQRVDRAQPRRSSPKLLRGRRAARGALLRDAAPAGRRLGRRLRQPARPCSPPGALGVPIVVVSYDRAPGPGQRARRPLRRGRRAVAFPDSPLPRAVVTGAPVRRAILAVDRAATATAARAALGLPADRFVVAVTGGSLGSGGAQRGRRRRTSADHADDAGLAVRHVVGERFARRRAAAARRRGRRAAPASSATRPHRRCVYAAADLLVGRGGASTVAEVAVTGTPAILVPWSARPRTTRPRNVALARRPGRGRAPARGTSSTGSAPMIERAARRPVAARRRSATGHAAGGESHRSGALGELDRTASPLARSRRSTVQPSRPPIVPARARRRRSTSSRPLRLHVVGVGGPGMSAIAIALAEMGHTCPGSDLREQPVLDRLRAAGVDGARRPRPPRTSTAATPSRRRRRSRRRNIELRRRPASSGIPTLRRAGMLASICAQARSRRRRRHARQDDDDVDADADPGRGRAARRASSSAATSPTPAPARSGRAASWLVVEADESDGTHLELPLHGTILTNVEIDHLDHYGTFERIVDELRPVPRPDRRAQGACAPTTRRCADAGRPPRRDHVRHSAPAPTYRAVDVHAGAGSFRVRRSSATGEPLGPDRPAAARRAQRRQRHRRRGDGDSSSACRSTAAAAALARFGGVARRFDIRGVDGGATFVDDYAHLPTRDRRRARRRPRERRRLAAGRRRVPAEPLQPHGRDVARLRRRLRRRRRRRAHRHLPVGHDADPGRHRPAGRQRRARRPSRRARRVAAAPRRPGLVPRRRGRRRATCASRWAAATSPRCPRRCSARRGGAERRESTTPSPTSTRDRGRRRGARRSRRARRAARRRSRPTASAGRRRCSCAPRTLDDLAARRAARARRPACRCSSSAAARTCSSPTRGFAGHRRARSTALGGDLDVAGRRPTASSTVAAGGAWRCRCSPGGPRPPG